MCQRERVEWHVAGGRGRRPEGSREGGGGGGQSRGNTEVGEQAAGAGKAGRAGGGGPSPGSVHTDIAGASRTGDGARELRQEKTLGGIAAHDSPRLLAVCQLPPWDIWALTCERLGGRGGGPAPAPSHSPFLTLLLDGWPCPRGTKVVGLGSEEWVHRRMLT